MNKSGAGTLIHMIAQANGKTAREVAREIHQEVDYRMGLQQATASPPMTCDDLDIPAAPEEAEIPALPDPPGRAGIAARWLATGSRVENRWPSIGAALVAPALLAGRRWMVDDDGLNLLMVLVGPSASGKEWLWSGLRMMVHRAGCDVDRVAAVKAASARGIAELLRGNPCIGIPIQEFGRWLGSASSVRGNPGDKAVADALLSLYSSSNRYGFWAGDARSGSVTVSIKSPCVSVVGETTQAALWAAMGDEMAGTGMLSRFLLLGDDSVGRDILSPQMGPMPPEVHDSVSAMGASDFLDDRTNVGWSPGGIEAHQRAFTQWSESKRGASETTRLLVSRNRQTAPRIAAALAIWDDPRNPRIGADHVEWAWGACARSSAMILDAFKTGQVATVETNGTDILLELAKKIMRPDDRILSQSELHKRARQRGWFRRQPDFVKSFHECLRALEQAELLTPAPRGVAARLGLARGRVLVVA